MYPVILEELPTQSAHKIGRATLHSPSSLNALSQSMIDALFSQLKAWEADTRIVAVFIDGSGEKAFCAGGDIVSLYHAIKEQQTQQANSVTAANYSANISSFFANEYRLDYSIHRYSKPIVCFGHGIVMGGGIGIYAGASHRVVTLQSRLAMPEISIGLFPDVGASWFLQRLPQPLGLFLAMSAQIINASDARYIGLADYVLEAGDKSALLKALTQTHWSEHTNENAERVSAVLQSFHNSVLPQLPASNLATHHEWLLQSLGRQPSLAQLYTAFTAFAQSSDVWLAQAGKNFVKGAPSSIALTYQALARARHMSLAEVLRMDYALALACAARADLLEGIRAMVIDKDKAPHWKPKAEIDSAYIDAHFALPLGMAAHPLQDLM